MLHGSTTSAFNNLGCIESSVRPQTGVDHIGIGDFNPLVARTYHLHFACFDDIPLKLLEVLLASRL